MTNTELAIQKAVEGGYVPKDMGMGTDEDKQRYLLVHGLRAEDLLDPLFWQALGKNLGWADAEKYDEYQKHWAYYQHRLIDAIQQGRSIDEFFGEILKK